MRTYEVWHRRDPLFRFDDIAQLGWPEEYELVATVQAEELDGAWLSTNHHSDSWFYNRNVTVVKRSRSTSTGDVVVDTDAKKAHICMSAGWKELD